MTGVHGFPVCVTLCLPVRGGVDRSTLSLCDTWKEGGWQEYTVRIRIVRAKEEIMIGVVKADRLDSDSGPLLQYWG